MSLAATRLRKKAAEFEALKQFDRAIAFYVRAIELSEKENVDVDVALLNKVGDLTLRQGLVADAVTYYERAVEHYATAGLFNNAIALCNKILRNAPGRSHVYFTLGRICARKGLRSDATRNFLEYATRMQQEERLDEGMRALAEISDLMPELVEIRRLVEEHAAHAGITLPQRRSQADAKAAPANPAPASTFSSKTSELVFLDLEDTSSAPADSTRPTLEDVMLFDPDADDDADANASRVESRGGNLADLMPTSLGESESAADGTISGHPQSSAPGSGDSAALSVDGLVSRGLGEPVAVDPIDGLSSVLGGDVVGDPVHGPDDTQALGEAFAWLTPGNAPWEEPAPAREAASDEAHRPPADATHAAKTSPGRDAPPTPTSEPAPQNVRDGADGHEAPFRLDPYAFVLPGELPPLILADDLLDGAAGSAAVPAPRRSSNTPSVPIASVAAEANSLANSRRDALRMAVGETPRDWVLRRRLAESLFEAGERDAGLAELETALAGFVDAGDFRSAAEIADELVRVAGERIPFHQKRVELAVRLQDQQRLRLAYLDLADGLAQIGDEGRARAVYARVLEIDPADHRAREALGTALPAEQAPEAGRPDDAVVDLADWLLDEDEPASTRMRMREPKVTGDEQADFDALLRHFKEGVSRSLGEDDFDSHYDLGVAYKEMGLLDDAISEFQKALRSRSHRLPAYEALGQCFVEQGRFDIAATVLSRALHEPGVNDEDRIGVLYLLALASESLQRWGEARSYYQRVYAIDINFRDAASRLSAVASAAQ